MSLLDQATLQELLHFAQYDAVSQMEYTETTSGDPSTSVAVLKRYVASVQPHAAADTDARVTAAKQRRDMSSAQKLDILRSFLSAAEFSTHKAGGLSAVEVSLYAKLGLQTTMVQQHIAMLAKPCADDSTSRAYLTNSIVPSHADPAFAHFGTRVATLLKGTDQTVERALREYHPLDLPAGALPAHAA